MPTKHNKNYGAVLLPLLILWPALTAQAANEEVIARCAKIPNVGDRILCLEDALRVSAQAGETAIDADAVAKENPTPDSSVAAAALVVAADDADLVETATEETGQSAPPDTVAAPAAEETMPAAAAAVSAADALEAQQFGLSETQKNPEPLGSINVVVVSVDSNAYGKLIFTTESGQVWRQTDQGRPPRYRQIPFDAEIRQGAVGSFFIRPISGDVSVRVKRSR
jgi:hypothetical protein